MRVISTNRSEPKTVRWKGREIQTGIYKYPVESGIILGATDVEDDAVVDRKYHGGIDKACYVFSAEQYPVWKPQYPELDWNYGMFGENLTLSDCDERMVYIGEQFQIGEAVVEVSEPREPCFKLGIRFGTQKILKPFLNQPHCGFYLRVLTSGRVQQGDQMVSIHRPQTTYTISDVYRLMFHATSDELPAIAELLKLEQLADSCKGALMKRVKLLGGGEFDS